MKLALVLVVLVIAGCGGYTPYGPQPMVAYRSLLVACSHHGGVSDFHKIIANEGAMALLGEYDFTCKDGIAGIRYWDEQGPSK